MTTFTTLILPVVTCICYFALLVILIKLIIVAYQTPKRIETLEKRIKQLEDKENS